jgi:hypothetical protein
MTMRSRQNVWRAIAHKWLLVANKPTGMQIGMGDLFYTSTCELCKRIHSALLAARACLSKSLASEN